MADSLLERKDRFVCITRMFPLAKNSKLVLEDIKLVNEREPPPAAYTILAHTVDTREKGTTKKVICVKMVDRQSGLKCICDIIFLYRSRRPPQSYTTIGDINGLQMCVKEGTVPALRPAPAIPETQSNIYPDPLNYQPADYANANTLTKKSDEREVIDGIPFQINPRYLTATNKKHNGSEFPGLDSLTVLSAYDIEQVYKYDFSVERSSL